MAQLEFTLEYDGPALDDHEMDARDFARAVLSAADLFQEMNRTVNPLDPDLGVNIRATAPGSFQVLLNLITDSGGVLTSTTVTATNNLAALINTFSGLIRYVRARGHAEVTELDEPGVFRLTTSDGVSLEVPTQVLGLSQSFKISNDLAEIVYPLNADGVDSLRVLRQQIEIERITKADLPALQRGPVIEALDAPDLPTTDRELWLQVVTVAFKEGNKWRFSDSTDNPPFGATISDQGFLAQIDDGEPFRKGDRMRVVLREVQYSDRKGNLRMEREIIRVLQHLPTGTQGRFDVDDH
jgi:hypothetical protein